MTASMSNNLTFCDATIHPGEVASLALPLPEQYACAPLYMPIKVIHGKKAGPCLVVFSGLNGNELNGLEIANRVYRQFSTEQIAGTLITIPVVNVYGLTHYPSTLPNRQHLVHCFPGNEAGSYGERVAALFTEWVLKKADYCIELQTGELNHNILPQVYCNFEDPKAKRLAQFFQTPVITHVEAIKSNELRHTTESLQLSLLVYQAGEAMRFDEPAVQLGVDGIRNLMKGLGMLEGEPERTLQPIFSSDEDWIITHKGGILHTDAYLGQTLKSQEIIGRIVDPFGSDLVEPVRAIKEGIVVGVNTTPLVHEGLPIFKMASFLDYDKAESVIEAWDQNQNDSYSGK